MEVSAVQIEKIENISGFNKNFRDPQPLNERIVKDGSDIVSADVTWILVICCISELNIAGTITSIAKVLGL